MDQSGVHGAKSRYVGTAPACQLSIFVSSHQQSHLVLANAAPCNTLALSQDGLATWIQQEAFAPTSTDTPTDGLTWSPSSCSRCSMPALRTRTAPAPRNPDQHTLRANTHPHVPLSSCSLCMPALRTSRHQQGIRVAGMTGQGPPRWATTTCRPEDLACTGQHSYRCRVWSVY